MQAYRNVSDNTTVNVEKHGLVDYGISDGDTTNVSQDIEIDLSQMQDPKKDNNKWATKIPHEVLDRTPQIVDTPVRSNEQLQVSFENASFSSNGSSYSPEYPSFVQERGRKNGVQEDANLGHADQ